MVDPEHRFLADRHVVALHQSAIAPQQPHFIRAFLPAIGGLGRDDDRLDVIALRHADLGQERCRQEEDEGRYNSPQRKQGQQSKRTVVARESGLDATADALRRVPRPRSSQVRGGAGRRRSFAQSFQQTSVLACLAKR